MKDIEEKIAISQLLAKHLSHSLDEEENKLLHHWLTKNDANKELLDELSDKTGNKERRNFINAIDIDNEWQLFRNKINTPHIHSKYKWKEWLSYAAAILLPLSVAFTILYQDYLNNEQDLMAKATALQPGSPGAKLILSNGQLVQLDTQPSLIDDKATSITIENKDHSLNYTTSARVQKQVFNELLIGHGKEYRLTLSDGTKVWLNSQSRLRFPVQFTGNIREVELEGEAFFEVAHNARQPFVVKTTKLNVEVLGTAFNLSNYSDEENVITTLVEGQVKVCSVEPSQDDVLLAPGEQAILNKTTQNITSARVDTRLYTGWKDGFFVFDNEPLESILRKLSRWYDIQVFFKSESARNELFSGKMPRFENCEKLLIMMEKTTDVQFDLTRKGYVIVDNAQ